MKIGKREERFVKSLLKAIGEDPDREGLRETPKRVVKAMLEMTGGYKDDPYQYVKLFTSNSSGLVSIDNIEFSSLCEHHLLPFSGFVNISYIPSGKVLGLSKFARIVNVFARRLQLQEQMTQQIFDFLKETLKPKYLKVYSEATHGCMGCRGVNQKHCNTKVVIESINGK